MRFLQSGIVSLALTSLTAHATPALPDFYAADEANFAKACATVQSKVVHRVNLNPDAKVKSDEDCEALYYAPGGVPDYTAAYKCALKENDRLVLMMLYANGYGVPRDVSAALKIACISTDGAPAEIWGRANHLATILSEGSTEEFDECNDVTSGAMQGHCAAIGESLDSVTRARRRAAITKSWSLADRVALAALDQAKKAYIEQHVASEADMTGTARGAEAISENAAQEDGFLDTLSLLESGEFPNISEGAFEQADRELNAAYRVTQQAKPSSTKLWWGTVTPEGIRETQRSWIRYRDAWVAFAANRYPSVSAASVKTYFTRERADILKAFGSALN